MRQIAVGGLGGSGTRVLAEILLNSGIYLGSELNIFHDNLLFTRFFKNPEWNKKSSLDEKKSRFRSF